MEWQRLVLTALVLSGFLTSGAATSRMGNAIVRDGGKGMPCFGLDDRLEKPTGLAKVGSVVVSERGEKDERARVVWSFMVAPDADGVALESDRCIPYGSVPVNARQLVLPSPLRPRVVYSVFVGTDPSESNDATQGHSAEFCLVPGLERQHVIQIPWDAKTGRRRYDLCGLDW